MIAKRNLSALVAIGLCVIPAISFAGCSDEPAQIRPPTATIPIDTVWTGTRVDFSAIADENRLIVGYYDAERWLAVSSVDLKTLSIVKARLESRFSGWDSHNSVAIALDDFNNLHVAANMHASPLNYFASSEPNAPPQRKSMVGRDEEYVTYPMFVRDGSNRLLFLYREGKSSAGRWLANAFDGSRWHRIANTPIFADRGFGKRTSAYPSPFTKARDGYFHIAIVWRVAPDAAANVRLSYAKTRNFETWLDSQGNVLKTPLTPESAETVLHTGPDAGLLNNARASIDNTGRPVIAFTRYGKNGNVVELARRDENGWSFVVVETSDVQYPVKGTGSLPNVVSLSNVQFSNSSTATISYRFPGQPRVSRTLNAATLQPECPPRADRPYLASAPTKRATGQGPTVFQMITVRNDASLMWTAQAANNDIPRECTPREPMACNPPPSKLELMLSKQQP